MDTGTKWEHYNAGQHARVSSMAGITYFVALPFDVADGSIVVGEPFGCPSPAIQDELNLGSGQCAGARDMNDTAGEFERLLGHAALKLWPDLPRDVQELLFETAVPIDPIIRNRLAIFLHDRHPRTAHPPKPTKLA